MTHSPMDDDELLRRLRANETSALTPRFRELARAAYDYRTMDAELAELVADSALAASSAVRASGTVRLLTFEGTELQVELEIEERGDQRHITGKLFPPSSEAVEIARPDGTMTTSQADEHGTFAAVLTSGGAVRLRVGAVELEWFHA